MKMKPCGNTKCLDYKKGDKNGSGSIDISNCTRYYMSLFRVCPDYKPEEEMKNENKITECQNKLNKAEKNIEDIRKELEQLKKESKVIMVPDNIHLADGEQILFNNDKQVLYSEYRFYNVLSSERFFHNPHKLIEFEELEKGKIYYHSFGGLSSIGHLSNYGIYDGKNFIYIGGNELPVKTCVNYSTILQAVPIEV